MSVLLWNLQQQVKLDENTLQKLNAILPNLKQEEDISIVNKQIQVYTERIERLKRKINQILKL